MGKAGRARVEDKYDMNKLNDELVVIYQQLLQPELPQPALIQELTYI
jgi:colanic acid/amylovoran biosynthesis glycosyltransferase